VTIKSGSTSGEEWPTVERRKPGWAVDWQSTVEREKADMARSLHDNTGGLLVAALMDINWAEGELRDVSEGIKRRLARAHAALDVAIGLNRRMIEDLRPSLLDDLGLLPALKWHFTEVCKAAAIACDLKVPEPSPNFTATAAIALYRMAQTLIALMVSHRVRALRLEIKAEDQFVSLIIGGDGSPEYLTREDRGVVDALASVTGRARALGGDLQFDTQGDRIVVICRTPAAMALTR
jgi:signal transduction histidine kinase